MLRRRTAGREAGLLIAVALNCLPAAAQEQGYRLEITPFAGYRGGGEFKVEAAEGGTSRDLDLDEDGSFGLIVNWRSAYPTEWEILFSQQDTTLGPGVLFGPGAGGVGDLRVTYLHGGGTYLFEGERALPYIVATVGASRFDPKAPGFSSETFFSFGFGGGWKVAPTSRIGLRLEGRLFGSFVDADKAIFCRPDEEGGRCLVALSGNILWQFEALAGLIVRF